MLTAVPINQANHHRLKPQYGEFSLAAKPEYSWHVTPPHIDELMVLFENGTMEGFMAIDDAEDPTGSRCEGFILYALEPHGAIEINVTYIPTDNSNTQTITDVLLQALLKALAKRDDWQTVSYAMLGKQGELVVTAPWYGLEPVGQAIQQFDLTNELALPILQKQHANMPTLGDEFTFKPWQDNTDIDAVSELVYKSFHKECDALWDPRFQSTVGAKEAITMMQSGRMGEFKPNWQTLLYKNDALIGFCFLLHTSQLEANIALIGVDKTANRDGTTRLGLGQHVLRTALVNLVKGIAKQEYLIASVTATMATDNIPAIHLYRKFGFQEVTHYPHTYLTRETAKNSYYGRRYFAEQPAGCCNH